MRLLTGNEWCSRTTYRQGHQSNASKIGSSPWKDMLAAHQAAKAKPQTVATRLHTQSAAPTRDTADGSAGVLAGSQLTTKERPE